jgi:hypothetical protein
VKNEGASVACGVGGMTPPPDENMLVSKEEYMSFGGRPLL